MSAPKVGDQIDNRYELCRQLGEGGTSNLFEAAHRYTGRRVVIEFLQGWEGVPEEEVRSSCGAFAVGRVRHPHLIEVSDAGLAGGTPYVVTSLLAGRSIEGLLASRGTFTPAETASLGLHVALALDALHRNDLRHGDVSPTNVWMVRSPLGEEQAELRNLRMTYESLAPTPPGGARWRPPPSIRPPAAGRPTRGPQSDLYDLGAVLFECLVGSAPPGVADRHGVVEVPSVLGLRPGTPHALGRIVERCLGPASEGFGSARSLIVSLEATRLAAGPTRLLAGTSQQALRVVTLPGDAAPRRATEAPAAISPPPPTQRTSAPSPAADPAGHMARRRVPRAAYSTPVRLLGHHGVMEGRIEDISSRGILAITATPLEVGSVVQLRFATPGSGAMVQCAGVLRWVRIAPSSKRAAMGFEFQATPNELRSAVEAYVAQQQSAPDAG